MEAVMSNEVHPVFQEILGAIKSNNVATARAVQQADADARDAAQWRWLQDSIKQTGGVAIWPEVNGIQRFQWGVPTDCDDEVDESMSAEAWKEINDEMRADDDRAGLHF